ncbi:unnamed protein product [Effrenium voratum]|uniref:Uncharacterized protein n=1 Tax=Effrenium voratum TaxID=2562239 RepID=A0AA36NF34_9DINO|nr:unnamed protein product [Effrenium voratum]CAJ1451150.1 unnamed protein product [Effrenium voratum]
MEAGLAVACQANLGSGFQVNLVDGGVVVPLVRQLKEGHAEERVEACTALARLAKKNPTGQMEIVQAGAVTPLKRQLMSATVLQRAIAATCISRVVEGNPEAQRAFALDGTHRALMGMLIGATMEERLQGAVALGHMACENPENQGRLVEEGAIEHLAQLLKAEEGLERDCTSFALANILNISYDQVVADITEAGEVDVALQIWQHRLSGQKRELAVPGPKKNPKYFFRSKQVTSLQTNLEV